MTQGERHTQANTPTRVISAAASMIPVSQPIRPSTAGNARIDASQIRIASVRPHKHGSQRRSTRHENAERPDRNGAHRNP
jgi:hypothetical protein